MAEQRVTDQIEPKRAQRPDARSHPRLNWFRQARFGAFIHWGLYALPDRWEDRPSHKPWWTKEWFQQARRIPASEYEQLANDFNPTEFDADAWAELFQSAGQKYVVITAKHHDGFCLFDSKLTDYNVVKATPFGRDIIAELAEACAKRSLRFGVYYSQTQDWHHPDAAGNDWDFTFDADRFDRYIHEYVAGQLEELLSNYGPICLVWFDTPMVITPEQSRFLLDHVHSLQDDCLVSGRIGNQTGDYATSGDNEYLTADLEVDWECPATMNDTWGYRACDHNWRSVDQLMENLRRVVAKKGNYLLNVGPDPLGRIPQPSVEALREMGQRLREQPL